jgi:transcriptional regulator with XRE-family HTH domain
LGFDHELPLVQHASAMGRARYESNRRFYASLGQRIAKVRKSRKTTQEELAKQLSLTRTSIINIEKGRQQVFVHTLTDLARVLGVSPSQLLPIDGDLTVLLRDKPENGREWILNAAGSLTDSDKG